jgi:hypothetical protein
MDNMIAHFNKIYVVQSYPYDWPQSKTLLFWRAAPEVAEAAISTLLENKDEVYLKTMVFEIVELNPNPDSYGRIIKTIGPFMDITPEAPCYEVNKNPSL